MLIFMHSSRRQPGTVLFNLKYTYWATPMLRSKLWRNVQTMPKGWWWKYRGRLLKQEHRLELSRSI